MIKGASPRGNRVFSTGDGYTADTQAMRVRLMVDPTPQQQIFIDCDEMEQLYGGAKRGAKSFALCIKIVLLSLLFPGNRILLCRKDFTDLRDSTLVDFFRICPREVIRDWNQTSRIITLEGGSTIFYRGLGDEHEVEKAKGLTCGAVGIDEPSEIQFSTYLQLKAQLNWVLPDKSRPPYMMLLACNPEPGWVKDYFITDAVLKQAKKDHHHPIPCGPNRVFVQALPRDNPHLPPGWEADVAANSPPDWIKKYLEGSWDVSEGQVFQEADDELHGIQEFDHSQLPVMYGAIDHASTGVSTFEIVGEDADENLYWLAEYYRPNRLISEHALAMRELMEEFGGHDPKGNPLAAWAKNRDDSGGVDCISQGRFKYILIDPSTTAKTLQGKQDLQSVADEYRRNGIPVIPGWNAMEMGVNLIKEALHPRPDHIHPQRQFRGAPSFFVVLDRVKTQPPSTTNGWKELKEWRKRLTPQGSVQYLGTDHGLDPIRYIFNSRPPRPVHHRSDLAVLTPQERFAMKAHDRWVANFGKKIQDKGAFTGFR